MKPVVPLLLVLLPACLGASPLGLLDQPQTFPWSAGLTPAVLEEAGGLAAGSLRIRTSALWFNTYRQAGYGEQMSQLVDMEGVLPVVSAAWSPAPGWELRSQVQGWVLGGGLLDGSLQGFHRFLGVANQGRENTSDNQYRNFLAGAFDDRQPAAGLTQAHLALRGFAGPWAWASWVKPPVPGHQGWGWSSRWGTGVGAAWGDRWPLPDWGLDLRAGVGAALALADGDPDFPAARGGLSGQGGWYGIVTTTWGPRFLVQGTWNSVPLSGGAYLDQGAGLLTLGGQFPLDRSWTLEIGFCEEFLTWATMEVGFQAGLVWRS